MSELRFARLQRTVTVLLVLIALAAFVLLVVLPEPAYGATTCPPSSTWPSGSTFQAIGIGFVAGLAGAALRRLIRCRRPAD